MGLDRSVIRQFPNLFNESARPIGNIKVEHVLSGCGLRRFSLLSEWEIGEDVYPGIERKSL